MYLARVTTVGAVLLFGVCGLVGAAFASQSYASLDEVPAGGGELRLSQPSSDVVGPDGAPSIAFPLRHTRVDVDVDGPMAQVQVEQTFENPFDEPLEAVYVFPMSAEAAVNAYEIHIGERVIKGEIRRKEEARRAYEEARAAGHTAGLLEQVKPNVFIQSLANIAPREEIRVVFRYVELLRFEDTSFELVYPMTIMPRYLPSSTSDPRPVGGHAAGQPASGAQPGATSVPYAAPQRSGHDIEVFVHVDAGVPVGAVESPSHRVLVSQEDKTTVSVELDPGDRIPNKDLVLRWDTAGESTLVGLLTHASRGEGFLAMMVQPKADYFEGDITAREVILLVDVSGSMSGPPLQHAKGVAHGMIDTLNDGDTFNIITFASVAMEMERHPISGDDRGRSLGHAYLDSLHAGGGTEINSGIQRALDRPPVGGRVRMVYVLTDGGVGNDDEVLGQLRHPEGENRIFTVGIGPSPNRYLLDRLAEEGRGFASYITLNEEVTGLVDELVKRTAWPYLVDLDLDWGGLDVHGLTPAILPDVFAGLPVAFAARYSEPGVGTVSLQARRAGKEVEIQLPVALPDTEDRPAVAYLWARRRIKELMAAQYGHEDPRIVAEITSLGLEFSLVTAYTSFVAIDNERVVEGGPGVRVDQPSEHPEGVDPGGTLGAGWGGGSSSGSSASGYSSYGGSSGGGSSGSSSGGYSSGAHEDNLGALDPFTFAAFFGLLGLAWARRRQRSGGQA